MSTGSKPRVPEIIDPADARRVLGVVMPSLRAIMLHNATHPEPLLALEELYRYLDRRLVPDIAAYEKRISELSNERLECREALRGLVESIAGEAFWDQRMLRASNLLDRLERT